MPGIGCGDPGLGRCLQLSGYRRGYPRLPLRAHLRTLPRRRRLPCLYLPLRPGVARPQRYRPRAPALEYVLPQSGALSLGVCNEHSVLVRTLFSGQARSKGRHVEVWDGLGDDGKALPAVTYRFRGALNPQSVQATYEFSIGNAGQPPYRTAGGKGS